MPNKAEISQASVSDLQRRKKISRDYLRTLSPLEKVERLYALQHQYYEMLLIREKNGGKAIPAKWKKWREARYAVEPLSLK